jgi:hypothetical protein
MLVPVFAAALATPALATPPCDPSKAVCSDTAGPGLWLQVMLVVAIVGVVAMAWFLLRGYRDSDRHNDGAGGNTH